MGLTWESEPEREIRGNRQAQRVAILICALISVSAFWSLENPSDSLVFLTCYFDEIRKRCHVHVHQFDQCMFGLKPPEAFATTPPVPELFTRKRSIIATNMIFCSFFWGRKCHGTSDKHVHQHAWGTAKCQGAWVNRAGFAGAYPMPLLPGPCSCGSHECGCFKECTHFLMIFLTMTLSYARMAPAVWQGVHRRFLLAFRFLACKFSSSFCAFISIFLTAEFILLLVCRCEVAFGVLLMFFTAAVLCFLLP